MVEGTQRRLTTIVAADIAGFSRLVGIDEEGTLSAQRSHRTELIEPLLVEYHGRIANTAGDSFLFEFPSAVEAVRCAMAVQSGMVERNSGIPAERCIEYRVGINIGDVVSDGDDLLGDGVNVAARLEGLAVPGGICISHTVRDQVRDRMEIALEDLGDVEVKNIARPVRVFRVLAEGETASPLVIARPRPAWQSAAIAITLLVLLAIGGGAWWWAQPPVNEPAVPKLVAQELTDKPSIAVLPFTNMSGDPEQEYFADGMTEDLITDLSKISGLFVIARNSSFSYKDQQVKVRQVAEELGVRYVLEGSVRRAGDEVRINAQLIDATTGGHIWAERYDGTLEGIFKLQDRITEQIVAALAVSLTGEEQIQQARLDTENAAAHDAFLQGWAYYRLGTREGLTEAVSFFEDAIRLDPDYARAHAVLATIFWDVWKNDWAFDLALLSFEAEERANEHLKKALKTPTTLVHVLQSRILASQGRYGDAVGEAEKAVAMDANDATARAGLAEVSVLAGKPGEALDAIKRAMRLDPHHPPNYLIILGAAQFGMERYEEAAETFERAVKRNPGNEPFIYLASTYGHLGRIEDADDAIDEANRLRNLLGLRELSLRNVNTYNALWFDNQIDFTRFGSKPVQERLRAGLTDIPALKWQYLVTIRGAGARFDVEGATRIDVPTAKSFHDRGVVFIDTSPKNIWNAGHIPGAVHLSYKWIANPRYSRTTLREVVGHDDEIVFYQRNLGDTASCCPSASWEAAKAVTWGYRKVYHFYGGAKVWKEAGYPIETGQ